MELQDQINHIRRYFRVLEGWEIHFNKESKCKCQCVANPKTKTAVIYDCDWNGGEVPKDYVLHELLHICLREIHHEKGFKKKKEELFIQDLCDLLKTKNLNT